MRSRRSIDPSPLTVYPAGSPPLHTRPGSIFRRCCRCSLRPCSPACTPHCPIRREDSILCSARNIHRGSEPDVEVRRLRRGVAACGHTIPVAIGGVAEKRAPTLHFLARLGGRVWRMPFGIGPIPVADPFPHVPTHIRQPQWRPAEPADRRREQIPIPTRIVARRMAVPRIRSRPATHDELCAPGISIATVHTAARRMLPLDFRR